MAEFKKQGIVDTDSVDLRVIMEFKGLQSWGSNNRELMLAEVVLGM